MNRDSEVQDIEISRSFVIYDLPFLDEAAKRAILGGNACRLFGLPDRS